MKSGSQRLPVKVTVESEILHKLKFVVALFCDFDIFMAEILNTEMFSTHTKCFVFWIGFGFSKMVSDWIWIVKFRYQIFRFI